MHAPDSYRPAVLLLSSLAGLSLSLITELLSHTFPLVLPSPSALAMPYLEMLDSTLSLCFSVSIFFCFVILSSFLLLCCPFLLLCRYALSLFSYTDSLSLRAVSVVNIDFFLVFSSPFVLDIYILLYPTTGVREHTRDLAGFYVDSCWKLSSP